MQSKGERRVKDEWEKQKGNAEEKENIGKLTYRLGTFGVPYQIGSRKKRRGNNNKKGVSGRRTKGATVQEISNRISRYFFVSIINFCHIIALGTF